MSYAKPNFTPAQVNASARIVCDHLANASALDDPLRERSFEIVDNWRSAHTYPLNAIHMTLKNRCKSISGGAVATAQRTKRLQSIVAKLQDRADMKLTQMQDIAGCRAILPNMKGLNNLRQIYETRRTKHVFTGSKDYIADPRESGYRSLHLKYRFNGAGHNAEWHGLKVEIQIRTDLQHRWATAVEAAGTFTKQALKSSKGNSEWLRFFALMSSAYALMEGCPVVPGTSDSVGGLASEIRRINDECHVVRTLTSYANIIPHIRKGARDAYYLIVLDPIERSVQVTTFEKRDSQLAHAMYTRRETKLSDTPAQVVLVAVSSVDALKKAYPNYFLDTKKFGTDVSRLLEGRW